MGLTYSNKAYGYKNARKKNDTEQLENNTKSLQLELTVIQKEIQKFYLS